MIVKWLYDCVYDLFILYYYYFILLVYIYLITFQFSCSNIYVYLSDIVNKKRIKKSNIKTIKKKRIFFSSDILYIL